MCACPLRVRSSVFPFPGFPASPRKRVLNTKLLSLLSSRTFYTQVWHKPSSPNRVCVYVSPCYQNPVAPILAPVSGFMLSYHPPRIPATEIVRLNDGNKNRNHCGFRKRIAVVRPPPPPQARFILLASRRKHTKFTPSRPSGT